MTVEFDLAGRIVPWGRDAEEYEAFFALSDVPCTARVLDCGGGPASFAAEWGEMGRFVVAVDPIFRSAAETIARGFEDTATRILDGMRRASARFSWKLYGGPEDVIERRRAALTRFVRDRSASSSGGRYVAAALPRLPFPSAAFDVVLCSHLLFLYSAELSLEVHLSYLREMLRVGAEVRVFPLLDMSGRESAHLGSCLGELEGAARVELVSVPFEFRRGDTKMLRLTRGAPA